MLNPKLRSPSRAPHPESPRSGQDKIGKHHRRQSIEDVRNMLMGLLKGAKEEQAQKIRAAIEKVYTTRFPGRIRQENRPLAESLLGQLKAADLQPLVARFRPPRQATRAPAGAPGSVAAPAPDAASTTGLRILRQDSPEAGSAGLSQRELGEREAEEWSHVFGAYLSLQRPEGSRGSRTKKPLRRNPEEHFRFSLRRWADAFLAFNKSRHIAADPKRPELSDARLAHARAQQELALASKEEPPRPLEALMRLMEAVIEARDRKRRLGGEDYAALGVLMAAPDRGERRDRRTYHHESQEEEPQRRRPQRSRGGEWAGRGAYGKERAVSRPPSAQEKERLAILQLREYEKLKALRHEADRLEKTLLSKPFEGIVKALTAFLAKAVPLLRNRRVTDLLEVQWEINKAADQLKKLKGDTLKFKRVQALAGLKVDLEVLIQSVEHNPHLQAYNKTVADRDRVYKAIKARSDVARSNLGELQRLAESAQGRLSVEHEGRRYPVKVLWAWQKETGPVIVCMAEGKGPDDKPLRVVDEQYRPEGGPPQGISLKQVEQFALGDPVALAAWLSEVRRLANVRKAEALKGITIEGLPVTHLRFFRSHPRPAHREPPRTGVAEVPPPKEERLQLVTYTDSALSPKSRHKGAERLPHEKGYTAVQSFSPDDELPEGLEDALGHAEDADRFLEAWRKALQGKGRD